MKTIKNLSLIFLALVALLACETTIDYDLPQEPSKITIDSKLIVGDTPTAYIFTSVSALSSREPKEVANASVVLFENGTPVSTLTAQVNTFGQTHYSSNYKILPNQLYRLQASLPNYPTAFGEGLSKDVVPIINTVFDTSSQYLSFTFQDPPTSGDYYLITMRPVTDDYSIFYSTNDVVINFFDENTFDDPFSGGEKYGRNGYMTDQFFNGKTKTVRLTIRDEGVLHTQTPLLIELWRISEDLYNHERTKAVAWQSENPFSEPVQIYSNIENGYGIVGTASVSRKQFYP